MNQIVYLYLGIFLTLSFYHFLVFFGRIHKKENLAYALLNLSICLMLVFNRRLFNNNINIILEYLTTVVIATSCFAYFFHTILDLKKITKFSISYYIFIVVIGFINNIIFITNQISFLRYINFVLAGSYALIFLIMMTFIIFKTKEYKKKEKKLYITGIYIILITMGICGILKFIFKQVPIYIIYTQYLFIILPFAIALTNNFNQEHRDLQTKTKQLEDLTNTLEQKVTDRTKALEEKTSQLEKAKNEIEQHNERIKNFFINLAHETRTPLTLISNYFYNVKKKFDILKVDINKKGLSTYEDISSSLAIADENVNTLQRNMVNFLDYQKLVKGMDFYSHDEIIDLSLFLIKKIQAFEGFILAKRLTLIADNLNKNLYIRIDPYALDRIVNNLFDNAVKYNFEYGKIIITAESKPDDKIELIIQNTASYIDEEKMKHVFEPYRQMSHEKRNIQGIGIGLNIVNEIMKQIDGKITAECLPENYVKFILTFKKSDKNKAADKNNTIISKPLMSKKIKIKEEQFKVDGKDILIVEDNPDMLQLIKAGLKDSFNLILAVNGRDALDKMKKTYIDLVISDIMMDEMDGYEFYNKLKERKMHAKVLKWEQ